MKRENDAARERIVRPLAEHFGDNKQGKTEGVRVRVCVCFRACECICVCVRTRLLMLTNGLAVRGVG